MATVNYMLDGSVEIRPEMMKEMSFALDMGAGFKIIGRGALPPR